MRYPIPERRPDPLIEAIQAGQLTKEQRGALADLVALLASEMATTAIARPGTLMDRTIIEAGSWGTLRQAWGRLSADLYPQAGV